jgi:hypothetical protein
MSFYITLPSDASMHLFQNNLIGKYTTRLFNPIDLDGEWDVGLAEIIYPISWHIKQPGRLTVTDKNKSVTYMVKFFANETYQNVANKMTKYFQNKTIDIEFNYDDTKNEFKISFKEDTIAEIQMDTHIAKYFGFQTAKFTDLVNTSGITSDTNENLESLSAFYVYTDIITHQFIGDANAKVLRVVALDQEYGLTAQYVNKIFDAPHYVSLERNNIETINIDIKNNLGENVPFESGKIVVKLHFRRRYF